jgi:hypothetical protein
LNSPTHFLSTQPEEERYTNKVIDAFNTGVLQLPESERGVTLRAYLAEKLGCDPMRITKKYTGASCLGKRVYHAQKKGFQPEELERASVELKVLEDDFRAKLLQMNRKRSNSSSSNVETHHMISTPAIDALFKQGSYPQQWKGIGHMPPSYMHNVPQFPYHMPGMPGVGLGVGYMPGEGNYAPNSNAMMQQMHVHMQMQQMYEEHRGGTEDEQKQGAQGAQGAQGQAKRRYYDIHDKHDNQFEQEREGQRDEEDPAESTGLIGQGQSMAQHRDQYHTATAQTHAAHMPEAHEALHMPAKGQVSSDSHTSTASSSSGSSASSASSAAPTFPTFPDSREQPYTFECGAWDPTHKVCCTSICVLNPPFYTNIVY